MTIAPDIDRRPQFTIGDRLRKARTQLGSDMDVRAFAELIGVSKNTVTAYELEKTTQDRMKPIVLRQWALATGVDFDWLVNGDSPRPGGPGAEMGPPPGIEPGTYSLQGDESDAPAAFGENVTAFPIRRANPAAPLEGEEAA